MLREIRNLRPSCSGARKRWFSDAGHDLITWQQEDEIHQFELCFGKGSDEHALIWRRDSGCLHYRVDDGENRALRHKMTPVLEPDGVVDFDKLRREFHSVASNIDPSIVAFVESRLRPDSG